MPVSTTRRGLSAIPALLLIVMMVLTLLQGAVPALAAPPDAPHAEPIAHPSLSDLFRNTEPDVFVALRQAATASGPGICSNDKTVSCSTSADCGGNLCYLPTAGGQTLGDQVCMQDAAGFGLQCTANDVTLAATHNLIVSDPCEFPGDTAVMSFVAEFLLGAQDRYDIGVWISQDGGNALTGKCSVSDFPISPTPPWTNLDAVAQPTDTCGDLSASNNPLYSSIQNITIQCIDHDGNGQADVNSCLSWRQPGSNGVCTSPLQAFPGAPSKCKCQSLPGIDILIPGQIIVDKVTHPSGSPQSFGFTLTGGPGNVNQSFSLTDQQTPYNSGGLKLGGTYAVSESVPAFWMQTGATCTSDQAGRTPTPSNIVLHNGETVTCTFTNEVSTKVNLRSFTATGGPRSVDVKWATASEVNNLGFNLYRATKIDGRRTQLNAQIIPTNQPPGSSNGSTYAYGDTTVKPKTTYYYWLESVDLSGGTQLFGPVSARPTK